MMEEKGFEPLNPKERIYSPPRLATSLLLQKPGKKPDLDIIQDILFFCNRFLLKKFTVPVSSNDE